MYDMSITLESYLITEDDWAMEGLKEIGGRISEIIKGVFNKMISKLKDIKDAIFRKNKSKSNSPTTTNNNVNTSNNNDTPNKTTETNKINNKPQQSSPSTHVGVQYFIQFCKSIEVCYTATDKILTTSLQTIMNKFKNLGTEDALTSNGANVAQINDVWESMWNKNDKFVSSVSEMSQNVIYNDQAAAQSRKSIDTIIANLNKSCEKLERVANMKIEISNTSSQADKSTNENTSKLGQQCLQLTKYISSQTGKVTSILVKVVAA